MILLSVKSTEQIREIDGGDGLDQTGGREQPRQSQKASHDISECYSQKVAQVKRFPRPLILRVQEN